MTLPENVHELVEILSHEQDSDGAPPEVRADALGKIFDLGEAAIPALLTGLSTTYVPYIQRAFVKIGQSAVLPLLEVLRESKDHLVRANAAFILGKLKDRTAAHPLIDALRDDSDRVRREAANALSAFKTQEMVLPLCDLLQDESPDVRTSAAATLGAQGDVRAVEPLNDAFLRDENERVRRTAHDAMKRIGARAQQENVGIIDRNRGARAAGSLQQPDAKKDTDEINKAVEKGHTFGIPRVELLIATLESDDHTVQRRAVRELIKMGDSVVEPLLTALDIAENAESRAHMVFALGELRAKAALPALHALVDDTHEDIRYAATHAIEKIEGERD